jgi:hypothetical protein
MDAATRRKIFDAQVENVRSLEAARKQIERAINDALRANNDAMAEVQTKLLGLLFCEWAEANFLKMLHMHSHLTLVEIQQIKKRWANCGITEGWKKCIELGLRHVPGTLGYKANVRQRLTIIVDRYVKDPSLLRNKLAHGQWTIALNRANTAVNPATSTAMRSLTCIQVDTWFECHRRLATIMENLVGSPVRTFSRDFNFHVAELQMYLRKTAKWSVATKKQQLQRKRHRHSLTSKSNGFVVSCSSSSLVSAGKTS